jgi:hypothetical protein
MEEILASIRRIIAEDDAPEAAAVASRKPSEPAGEERSESGQDFIAEGEALYASLDSQKAINPPSGAAGVAFKTLEFFGPSGEARAGCLLELYQDKVRALGVRGAGSWLFWQAFWIVARLIWGLLVRLIQFDQILQGPHLR